MLLIEGQLCLHRGSLLGSDPVGPLLALGLD
jgi:hypothetical protein